MKTQCPNCQATYHIIPEFIGRKTVCQICGQAFPIAEVREEDQARAEAAETEEPRAEAARAAAAQADAARAETPPVGEPQPEQPPTETSPPERVEAEEPRAGNEAPGRAAPTAAHFPAILLAKTVRPASLSEQLAKTAEGAQPATAGHEPDEAAVPDKAAGAPADELDEALDRYEAAGETDNVSAPQKNAGEFDARPETREAADDPDEQPEPRQAIGEPDGPAEFSELLERAVNAGEPDEPPDRPEAGDEADELPEPPETAGKGDEFPEPREAVYETIEPADFSEVETAPPTAAGPAAAFHPEPKKTVDDPGLRDGDFPAAPTAVRQPPDGGGSWLVQIGFGVLGVILGAGMMWLLAPGGTPAWRSADPDAASAVAVKVAALNEERARLRSEIDRAEAYIDAYPAGSVPQALAVAVREEYGLADALLLQQAAALETGVKVTVSPRQSQPDPELAGRLEKEIADLTAEIARQQREAETLADVPRLVAATSIETLNLNLGILKRNYLTAKYGLSAPLSPPSKAPPEQEAELERLKAENAGLRAENEQLLNSAAALYARALAEVEAGHPAAAADTLRRISETFPDSPLNGPAADMLARIEIQAAVAEAAQKPPVVISSASLKHDGGYFENETQVRIAFQNVSPLVIKQLEFKVLTFDEDGLPVASRKRGDASDNDLNAVLTENIPPNKADYGLWELSDQVRQVKIKLKKVDFYDAESWVDESVEEWLKKESGRFAAAQ